MENESVVGEMMRHKIAVIVVLVFTYMLLGFSQDTFGVAAQDGATPQPSSTPRRNPPDATPVVERRTKITINDPDAAPENLTSSQDGTVFFGSITTGIIYRALPGVVQAEAWIPADTGGLTRVFGVLADDEANTLWVCANVPTDSDDASNLAPAVFAYDLETGEARGTYPFPDEGLCNDIAVAADGTVYVTDFDGGRIFRLQPGAESLDIWLNDPEIAGVDGLSLLEDGALYVNNYYSGTLSRIPVTSEGDAGSLEPLELSMTIENPDGLRAVGPNTLLQAEGSGRLTEITIDGDHAEVRVVQDELSMPTGITVVGTTAFVLIDFFNAVAVPMAPSP